MAQSHRIVSPIFKSLLANGSRACLRPTPTSRPIFNYQQNLTLSVSSKASSSMFTNHLSIQSLHTSATRRDINSSARGHDDNQSLSIVEILEREIQDETSELSQHLTTEQFPGFSVDTNDADVKLTKQVGNATVTVRFTVSSSLEEIPKEPHNQSNAEQQELETNLVSMPDFQVQIHKGGHTMEMSCYFEDTMEQDEETGESYGSEPMFNIDELVIYQGEAKESEFAVSANYFQEDLLAALLQYLSDHGINEEFGKNLVAFSTSYEKKQYISLMKRLKSFVSK